MKLRSAQAELVHMDLQTVIEKMNKYASSRLRNTDIKQLEGRTPEDFTSDTILKVLEGIRNWEDANTDNMEAFLIMSLNSEISNFLKKIGRRDIGIFTVGDTDEYTQDYDDKIREANPSSFNTTYDHEQSR